MLRVCSRFVNPEDAKELAGDAIAWLWEHRQDLRIETSLSSYLLKSVQNRALNLRQRGRTPLPRTVGLGEKGDR